MSVKYGQVVEPLSLYCGTEQDFQHTHKKTVLEFCLSSKCKTVFNGTLQRNELDNAFEIP